MRALWFRPKAVEYIEPEMTTAYAGGRVSTAHPIDHAQARAVVAQGNHRANELLSLLEGAGFVATGGNETWAPATALDESSDSYDECWNGREHVINVSFRYGGEPTTAADMAQRFERMPTDAVERVRYDDPNYNVIAPRRHGRDGHILLFDTARGPQLEALVRLISPPYFFAWTTDHVSADEERDRLGFGAREWFPHPSDAPELLREEAIARVRLYLIGAGVAPDEFAVDREEAGWSVVTNGGRVRIGDDGVIRPGR